MESKLHVTRNGKHVLMGIREEAKPLVMELRSLILDAAAIVEEPDGQSFALQFESATFAFIAGVLSMESLLTHCNATLDPEPVCPPLADD